MKILVFEGQTFGLKVKVCQNFGFLGQNFGFLISKFCFLKVKICQICRVFLGANLSKFWYVRSTFLQFLGKRNDCPIDHAIQSNSIQRVHY